MTGIEWTDATWNPLTGCAHVSPGCDGCYAAREAAGRLSGNHRYAGLAVRPEGGGLPRFTGEIRLHPDRVDQPLRWRKPRRVFVNSMSDLFHPDVPDEFIVEVFSIMQRAESHQFQVLTKRPQRMADLLSSDWFRDELVGMPEEADIPSWPYPFPNVWLGTSIESDRYAFRADHGRHRTPAAVRFISAEPLLGPLQSLDLTGIDWLIVGGESGPQARPMHPDWVRGLRDYCTEAGVSCSKCEGSGSMRVPGGGAACDRCFPDPLVNDDETQQGRVPVAFFFKQWGEWAPSAPHGTAKTHLISRQRSAHEVRTFQPDGTRYSGRGHDWSAPGMVSMIRVGKKAAGRELDGRTWDEWPA